MPVWVPLAFSADWRWLQQREDTLWYPTMRLFRQQRAKDWPEVFARIAAALHIESQKPRSTVVTIDPVVPSTDEVPSDDEVYRYSEHAENEPAPSSPTYSDAPSRSAEHDSPLTQPASPISPQMAHVRKLLQARHYAEAEQLLRQILADTPADADAWFHLAHAQQIQNRPPDALTTFRRLLELHPGHAQGHASSASPCAGWASVRKAKPVCVDAIRLQPTLARAHNNLGSRPGRDRQTSRGPGLLARNHPARSQLSRGHFNLAICLVPE